MDRRQWLAGGAAWTAASYGRVFGANDRINIGLIGYKRLCYKTVQQTCVRGRAVLLSVVLVLAVGAQTADQGRPERRETPNRQWEEQFDKRNVRHSAHMVTDASPQFLAVPSYAYPDGPTGFDVAKTPPTVDFAILQLSPEYLPLSTEYRDAGIYGGWGEVKLGPDGKYYFATGNHKGYGGATAFLTRYDPKTKTHETVLSSQEVCGWGNDQFGDGKIHGEPDISPSGDAWLLTFFGPYPKYADWGKNYFGG